MKKIIQWLKDGVSCYKGYLSCWQYWVVILIISFSVSGCSLIPRFTFDTPNSVPQSIDKSKAKEVCKGKTEWDDMGNIKSCSKGYYRYDEGYKKQERKMTIVERIKSFINNLAGISFWIFVALIIFAPGLIGTVVGRIIESTIGITGKSFRAVIRGVQTARKNGKDLSTALATEMDADTKKYVAKVKEQEKIK